MGPHGALGPRSLLDSVQLRANPLQPPGGAGQAYSWHKPTASGTRLWPGYLAIPPGLNLANVHGNQDTAWYSTGIKE
jgi:hypothetical protein